MAWTDNRDRTTISYREWQWFKKILGGVQCYQTFWKKSRFPQKLRHLQKSAFWCSNLHKNAEYIQATFSLKVLLFSKWPILSHLPKYIWSNEHSTQSCDEFFSQFKQCSFLALWLGKNSITLHCNGFLVGSGPDFGDLKCLLIRKLSSSC